MTLLYGTPPIFINPNLAKEIGLEKSLVVGKVKEFVIDWNKNEQFYVALHELHQKLYKALPFIKTYTIGAIVDEIYKEGYLITDKQNNSFSISKDPISFYLEG